MSFRTSIEKLFEEMDVGDHKPQEFNSQQFFLSGFGIVHTDSGEYKKCHCYPEYWTYGETIAAHCLSPLEFSPAEIEMLHLLVVTKPLMNENGFTPVSIYPGEIPENDMFLVTTVDKPLFMLMDAMSYAYLNEHSKDTMKGELLEENNILTRHYVTVAEDGTITQTQ